MNPLSPLASILQASPDGDIWIGLVKERLAGRITHEDILEAYRHEFKSRYDSMLSQYHKGDLFKCQRMDLDAYLSMPGWMAKEERETAAEFRTLLENFKNEDWIIRFHLSQRIDTHGHWMDKKTIREDSELRSQYLEYWSKQNSTYNWLWR